ncbi:MAG: hypothetical protein HY748_11780 [Elusimicrobia bacterium]|nr:hypothetical protein [Elusimicrobiota bacterium]
MDLLLRLTSAKTLLVLLVAFGGLVLAVRYRAYPIAKFNEWRYPAQKGSSPLGAEILRDLDNKEHNRIESLYRSVLADLAKAKSEGFEVADLETRADTARSFNAAPTRADADRLLNEVRRDIPIKASETVDLRGSPP